MKTITPLLRMAAVAGAVTLLSLYVYDRAGGNLFNLRPASTEPTTSSDLAPSTDTSLPSVSSEVHAMPGSKSAPVFVPSNKRFVRGDGDDDSAEQDNQDSSIQNQPKEPVFLPGSKSGGPSFNVGFGGDSQKTVPPPQVQTDVPKEPRFLPGPKSWLVVPPEESGGWLPTENHPSAPPQTNAPPAKGNTKQPTFLPGSKAPAQPLFNGELK